MFGGLINQAVVEAHQKRATQQRFDSIKGGEVGNDGLTDVQRKQAEYVVYSVREEAWNIVFDTVGKVKDGFAEILAAEPELSSTYFFGLIDAADDDYELAGDDELHGKLLTASIFDLFLTLRVPQDIIDDIFGGNSDQADDALLQAIKIINAYLEKDGVEITADDFQELELQFVFGEPTATYRDLEKLANSGNDGSNAGYDSATAKHAVGSHYVRRHNGHLIHYTAVKAIRHGKIVTVAKRVGGFLKQTAKEKHARLKNIVRAHTARANASRIKSVHKLHSLHKHGDKLSHHEAQRLSK